MAGQPVEPVLLLPQVHLTRADIEGQRLRRVVAHRHIHVGGDSPADDFGKIAVYTGHAARERHVERRIGRADAVAEDAEQGGLIVKR